MVTWKNTVKAALGAVVVVATSFPKMVEIPEGANADVFAKVYKLIQLQEKGSAPDGQQATAEEELTELAALNMSLSDPAWQKLFLKEGKDKLTWEDKDNHAKTVFPHGKDSCERWAIARHMLEGDTPAARRVKTSKANKLQGHARRLAAAKVNAILNTTMELRNQLQTAHNNMDSGNQQAIADKLAEAIYGETKARDKFATNSGNDNGAATVTACNSEGKIQSHNPLAYVAMCLVLEKQGGGENPKPLYNDQNPSKWAAGGTGTKTTYDAVRKLCSQSGTTYATAQSLRTALQDLHSAVTVHNDAAYLGWTASGTCDGDSNNGLCVRYSTSITSTGDKWDDLTFARAIIAAAALLERKQQAEQNQKPLKKQL